MGVGELFLDHSSFFQASEQNPHRSMAALSSPFCYESHASGLDLTLAHRMEATSATQEQATEEEVVEL